MQICALDKNLSTGIFTPLKKTNDKIACTYTTERGNYLLRNIVNDDPNDNTNVDLYLHYSTNGEYVNIKTENGRYYNLYSKVQNNFSDTGTTRMNDNLINSFFFERAIWILDTLHDAREYFDDEDVRVKPVNVIWEHGKELKDVTGYPSNCNDNACYERAASTIWLDGADPISRDPIGDEHHIWLQLHEYGHHVMRNEYGLDGWGGCDGDSHDMSKINSETCAWSEGWADFVPHLVTDDSEIQVTTYAWADLEKDGFSSSALTTDAPYVEWPTTENRINVGHLSEGQVASMLWDIKDNNQDVTFDKNKDNINERRNGNDDNIIRAFGGDTKDIVNDFYLEWNSENHSKTLNSIADLHYILLNELPTANAQTVNVASGSNITIILTGSDPENKRLEFQKVTDPSKGTLSPNNQHLINYLDTSAILTYTPNSGATGEDSFTFRVSDGSYDSSTVKVTINIQPAPHEKPVLENVRNVNVAEGSSMTINVRATDVDNDSIRLSLQGNPSWVSISDNNDGTGLITVNVPNEVSETQYRMKAAATDNDGTDTDSFRVYITEVNQTPTLDSIGSKTIQERQNLSFTVSATDSDRPSQTLRYSIADTPIPDNINFNTSTGAFSWTPNDRQKGFHSYIFTVTDSKGATDSETVSITVTAIPDSSPNKTTRPTSSSITSTSATINWNAPSPGTSPITGYDIFREASPKVLIATVPSTQLSYVDNTVLPSTTYQYTVSAKNQHGSGSQSDPITITTLADTIKPVIVPTPPNSITLIRGDVYSELGAVCTDNIDGNISNVIIATNINTAIPGAYQVTYDCQDTAGNSAVTVTRTVNVVIPQVPPVLSAISDITVNEGDTKSFTVSATDENNDTITYALVNSPPWASISGSTVTISTPVELSGSSYAATVTATDDDGTDTESFFIAINEVNQSPSLDNISDVESEQNKQISFTITATDPDTPAQSLSYSMTGNPVGAAINSNTGAFTWTPNESQTGIHSITFTVTDNGTPVKSDSQSVSFVIADVTAPTITLTGDNPQTIELGAGYTELGAITNDGSEITIDASAFVDAVGTYSIIYNSVDSAGNQAVTVSRTVDVSDTMPPTITINQNTITLELGSATPDLLEGVTSDDVAEITTTGSVNVNVPGSYTITYHSTDSAGNIADTATRTYVISDIPDTTAPAQPTINQPTSPTTDSSITITGTAPMSTVLAITLNDGGLSFIIDVNIDGTWSYYIPLIEGENRFTAISTDRAGNTSVKSNAVTIFLDTTAPVITVDPITITIEADSSSPDLLAGVSVNDDSEITTTGIVNVNVPGDYIITYHSTDSAGNTADTATRTYVISDIARPDAPTINQPTSPTTDSSITITGTAPTRSILALTQNNDELPFTVRVSIDGTWSQDVTLIEGENMFTAVAFLETVSSYNSNTVNVTYTVARPDAPTINQPTTPTDNNSVTITGTAPTRSMVNLTQNDNEIPFTVRVSIDGTWSQDVILIEGENTFTAIAWLGTVASDNSNTVNVTYTTDIIFIDDSFDSFNGWEKYSRVLTDRVDNGFENYDVYIDSTTGRPAPSVHISGDGYYTQVGIQKTIDISSVDEDSPLYFSLDFMVTSENDMVNAPTVLQLFDGIRGTSLYGVGVSSGNIQSMTWTNYSKEISSVTSGHDSITIRIYTFDFLDRDDSKQNWYDNVYLGTIEPPMSQSTPPAMILSDDIIYSSSNASNDTSLSAIINTPSDVITDTEYFVISGTSTGADQIALYRDGTYTNEWVIPDETGDWAFNVMLVPGENVLGVTVVNEHDMTSPNDITVTLDIVE